MQGQQLELWKSKEGKVLQISPLYQELTPDQHRQIIEQLARLILKQARNSADTDTSTNTNTEKQP